MDQVSIDGIADIPWLNRLSFRFFSQNVNKEHINLKMYTFQYKNYQTITTETVKCVGLAPMLLLEYLSKLEQEGYE